MNTLFLADKKISRKEVEGVVNPVFELYRDNTAINPQMFYEKRDYSNLQWQAYNSNKDDPEEGPDYGIDKKYLSNEAKDIKDRYGYEVDYVTFLVHNDSWNDSGDGVWGWNIAQPKYGYEVQQVRWDTQNEANTTGTINHETLHPHDTFCYRNIGIWLESIVGVDDWDSDVVHGGHPDYEYVQYLENENAIRKIAPYLERAFKRRRSMQKAQERNLKSFIQILESTVDFYNSYIISKRKKDVKLTADHL